MSEANADVIDLTDERRPMRVCAYVELPFEAVLERFLPAPGYIVSVVASRALGAEAEALGLSAHDLEIVSRWVARLRLSWRAADSTSELRSATLSLLAVQSGHDALTELLVDVPVGVATARHAAEVVQRLLAELDNELTRLVPA